MARGNRRIGHVRPDPVNVHELRPWLAAVEDWRRVQVVATPCPRRLLDLLEPGAPWMWTVACTLERLEMEDLSGIAFPMAQPGRHLTSSTTQAQVVAARDSEASAPTHRAPQPSPVSARTSEWLRVLEEAISESSHPGALTLGRNNMCNTDSSANKPSLFPHGSTSSCTMDSEHSCNPPGGAFLQSWDSYDPRPGIEVVRAYLTQQRIPGQCAPLKLQTLAASRSLWGHLDSYFIVALSYWCICAISAECLSSHVRWLHSGISHNLPSLFP